MRLFFSVMPLCLLAALTSTVVASPSAIQGGEADASNVSVEETPESFILSNGIVSAQILKRNGDLYSLKFKGVELLTNRSGHAGGYWSHDTSGGKGLVTRVTIDPQTNGGNRGEVSIKGVSGGAKMGHGPGVGPDGDFQADIEIRYALGRGDSGIYTYCIFEHPPEYGAATMSEARFAVKLADFFDWMSVDEKRNKLYPKIIPSEDKYVFTALQSVNRAYGFSSTERKIGFYLINPSAEYLSGGPTKPEFLCHRDTTPTQAPVVLNYWRSSHYGGATVAVEENESWTKVIGPFLLYANEGGDPNTLWREAQARAVTEAQAWPYHWVDAAGYATPEMRGVVAGRLELDDPQLQSLPQRIWVGLAHPPYRIPAQLNREREISWQTDAKHYQFWAEMKDAKGEFQIPDVVPGNYTLYAFADGVLGELIKHDITVGVGETVDLGVLNWKPVRHGVKLWEIGEANRSGGEFAGGDRYFDPKISLQYAKDFPNDVVFAIGQSRVETDWFFAHVPHNVDQDARVLPYRGVSGAGRATPYTIQFTMDEQPVGTAVLRLAICGTGARTIDVSVNGEPAGQVHLSRSDGVIARHQIQGLWYEREVTFDASLLKPSDNTLTLTIPAGPINNGVVYDYLRLELNDTPFSPPSGKSPALETNDQVTSAATAKASATSVGKEVAEQQAQHRSPRPTQSVNKNFPINWWRDISKKPESWYRSTAGRDMAKNILSWQDDNGGWPLMNTTRELNSGAPEQAGPWGTRGALVKATVNEIRFLGRAYQATQDKLFLNALTRGVEFLLKAQHPTGGWPRTVPPRKNDYTHYATFNDDQMTDVMTLLQEVATSNDFRPLDSRLRKRAGEAFSRGIDFILKSQIVVSGSPTGWAQQHDELNYEPRPARPFEPVAISGGESAGVLKLLMDIKRPSPEIMQAIEAGVAWYRTAQIDGMEYVRTTDDRVLRPNPDAGPLWARFYEIGANQPIFAGRDGVVHYNLDEIEKERRLGYAWFTRNGVDVLRRYADWRHAQKWRDQPPTNTDESAVRDFTLPDPLTLADGQKVTSVEVWETERRPELMKLFAEHQFGRTPSESRKPIFEVVERDAPGLDGSARRSQARIRFGDDPESPVIRVLRYVPNNAPGPVPTLLYLGFSPNVMAVDEPGIDEGMAWSAKLKSRVPDRDAFSFGPFDAKFFVDRGYGIVLVYYGDIEPDFDHGGKHGVRSLFSATGERRAPHEWGSIGGWSWGLSRVLDYLQTDAAVDGAQVALAGVSRLGKTVLWAAAQDERFALVIPLLSGEGGAAVSRRNYGETVADLTNPERYHYWYAPRYADYAFDVDTLPVDGHLLVSLIAPRPVLQIVGSTDTWSDPKGEWIAAKSAQPVYEMYGLTGPTAKQYPQPGGYLPGDLGFFMHGGGHTVIPRDFEIIAEFMDQHLQKPQRPRSQPANN